MAEVKRAVVARRILAATDAIEMLGWFQVPLILAAALLFELVVGRVWHQIMIEGAYWIDISPRGAGRDDRVWVETNGFVYWWRRILHAWAVLTVILVLGLAFVRYVSKRSDNG